MLLSKQLRSYEEEGYLVVEDLLDRDTTIARVVREYESIARTLSVEWVEDGKLATTNLGASFEQWVVDAYRSGLDYFQPMDISLPAGRICSDTPFHAGPAVFDLMTNGRLLDAVEQIIGPEITSNPVQHVRIKPPAVDLNQSEVRAHITATDWHQDRAVGLPEADQTRMVTAWVAITDATVANGCLQVIPGSHRGAMLAHVQRSQVGIPGELIDESRAVALPVQSGGAILFHPLTIHRSLENTTSGIRWSFDLRYNVTGQPTGRPFFPEFVARSRAAPESELRSAARWRALWDAARSRLAEAGPVVLHRWPS